MPLGFSPNLGDIVLDSEAYSIDMDSYRVRDIVDFAPRASEPGGSIIHSELGLYQPYMRTDWRHGFGFAWETDAEGYMRTDGSIDTRHPGVAMMMTQSVNDSDAFAAEGYATINDWDVDDLANSTDYTIAWGAQMRKRTIATAWTDTDTYGAVNFVMQTNLYIHVCVDGARIQRTTKATDAQAATGVNASSVDYRWLIVHEGFIYAGKDASSLIFRDANEDLSALAGIATDDPNVVVIGGDLPTIGAVSWSGKLLVSRQDGLFHVGSDLVARRLLDFSKEISSTNFRSMAIYNNRLVFPIRDTLYTWNGTTLADITPPFISDEFPYVTYGRFDNFVSAGGYLYMTARTNDGTYSEDIICFDGVGWHKLARPISNGTDTVTAMGYDVLNNYLWYSVDATTDTQNFIQFQNVSEFPFANFPTTGTHSLVSGRMDMGFRRVTKSTPSIIIEGDNLTTARYLVVFYNINNAGWLEWNGTNNGRITVDGVTTLTNPVSGGTNSTLQYNHIQIRIDFVTDATGQSPILEGITLRFIMRPATLYGHFFNIIAASNLKIGSSHRSLATVREIYTAVNAARASTAPITFVDPFGVSVTGYVASIERRAVERHGRQEPEGFPDIESQIMVNFVEVG